jgi:hypothetical protein
MLLPDILHTIRKSTCWDKIYGWAYCFFKKKDVKRIAVNSQLIDKVVKAEKN